MRLMMSIIIAVLVIVLLIFLVNRFSLLGQGIDLVSKPVGKHIDKSDFTVVSWNLGYAGLGEESDFFADGGEQSRPLSKALVLKNAEGIENILSTFDADFYLFQEVTRSSYLNYNVNLFDRLVNSLGNYAYFYHHDLKLRLIPPPLALDHGKAIFSRYDFLATEFENLTNESDYYGYMLKKNYNIDMAKYEVSNNKQLVLINLHLAAFDDQALVRKAQLADVITIVEQIYQAGHYVVVGGDWNMMFDSTNFPHKTDKKHLFWLYDFPKTMLPEQWQLLTDLSTPTVRTNHQPYSKDDNYVTNIDGFLVSPNVMVKAVSVLNTDFKYTDHQPVVMSFSVKRD